MSDLIKAGKEQQVNVVFEKLSKAKSFLVFEYHGLTAKNLTDLRANLKQNDCEVLVLKNNITKRACEKLNLQLDESLFTGPNAVAIGYSDELAAIKGVYETAGDHDCVKVKGGVLDGKVVNASELSALATIPGRDGLLSMIAQMLQSPVTSFARAVQAVADSKPA